MSQIIKQGLIIAQLLNTDKAFAREVSLYLEPEVFDALIENSDFETTKEITDFDAIQEQVTNHLETLDEKKIELWLQTVPLSYMVNMTGKEDPNEIFEWVMKNTTEFGNWLTDETDFETYNKFAPFALEIILGELF